VDSSRIDFKLDTSMNAQLLAAIPAISPDPMQIIVALIFKSDQLRERCKKLLPEYTVNQALNSGGETGHSYEIEEWNKFDKVTDFLDSLFEAPGRWVIVISDLIANSPDSGLQESPLPTTWWQPLVEKFPDNWLGSVAVTDWAPRRVPDVDRVVPTNFDQNTLLDAVHKVVRALEYKRMPQKRSPDKLVRIRHIREDELRSYYELRHRSYSIMGYFDHEIETVPLKQEFDWFDQFSVPIGAFIDGPDGRACLIGTTRLITTQIYSQRFIEATSAFASQDHTGVLKPRFEEPAPFQMPFLQSLPDNGMVADLNLNCANQFCEISRVIVAEEARGIGLSKWLVKYTLTVARWLGMRRMFLECLPTHTELYKKFRFEVVPDRRQRVFNVNKTMTLMAWSGPQPLPLARPDRPHGEDIERLREQGFLCFCEHESCPAGGSSTRDDSPKRYQLFGTPTCPLTCSRPRGKCERHLLREWDGMEFYYED
jgi:GNAT superfamily N-acetyltransferase